MRPATRIAAQTTALIALLVLFFVSLELMGASFKLMGRGFAEGLMERTRSIPSLASIHSTASGV